MSDQIAAAKLGDQAAQGGVLAKLIAFAVALAAVPMSTYYGTQRFVWNGDPTSAAISAVVAANVVLAVYIAQSVYEDRQSTKTSKQDKKDGETRKDR
ncbi:hypothetical protein EW145_g3913 [Phellinidium pouzarii]|uniref:Vacuolar ATPase assembly integral membrane protein VMA21 n=1 Tax=Phellinidium pouzarii TaxID=167371 RepID=A0A4S4L6V5_9AGAM|nr:hypothetical protein EW145_g3913 [Phellinidium pouzarii]